MTRKVVVTVALIGLVITGRRALPVQAEPAYEFWPSCNALPPEGEQEFLPIFLPGEEEGFVDLGQLSVQHGGQNWKAMQFTRDKDFGATTVPVGKWVLGVAGDEWPAGTVNVQQEMLATRMVAWEIDGHRYDVNPSCFLNLSSSDGGFGLYNVWARFNAPGAHTLRIILQQIRDFYFVYPFDFLGVTDPFGLDGRRVFVRGEVSGDDLDGFLIHRYDLNVVGGG